MAIVGIFLANWTCEHLSAVLLFTQSSLLAGPHRVLPILFIPPIKKISNTKSTCSILTLYNGQTVPLHSSPQSYINFLKGFGHFACSKSEFVTVSHCQNGCLPKLSDVVSIKMTSFSLPSKDFFPISWQINLNTMLTVFMEIIWEGSNDMEKIKTPFHLVAVFSIWYTFWNVGLFI